MRHSGNNSKELHNPGVGSLSSGIGLENFSGLWLEDSLEAIKPILLLLTNKNY